MTRSSTVLGLVVVVGLGGLLFGFASITETHKCGDVGCAPSEYDWARAAAIVGCAVGSLGLTVARGLRDAAAFVCVLAYLASAALTISVG